MNLVRFVQVRCKEELERVSNEICDEMKSAAHRPTQPWTTGLAAASVKIHNTGEQSRFVGALGGEGAKHLYYLNEGNGGKGAVIKPRTAPQLHLKGLNIYRKSVHGYSGIHFIEKIAARHGG